MFRFLKLFLCALSLFIIFGCDSNSDDDDSDKNETATTVSTMGTSGANPCGTSATDGQCLTMIVKDQSGKQDMTRAYFVRKPQGTVSGKPGLMLVMHGLGDTQDFQLAWFQARTIADKLGMIIVAPRGTVLTGALRPGRISWNATTACCYFDRLTVPSLPIPDDVSFVTKLIDEQIQSNNVDSQRVVMYGFSNGAFMSHRYACEHSNKVSAIVTFSGLMRKDVDQCQPENRVSVLQVHGTADPTIPYLGSTLDRDNIPLVFSVGTHASAPQTVTHWAAINGCTNSTTGAPFLFSTRVGLDNDLRKLGTIVPNPELPEGQFMATKKEYSGCKDSTSVQLVTVEGGAHGPYYLPDVQLKLVQDFFQQYGTRNFAPFTEIADAPHKDIFDPDVSYLALSGKNEVPALDSTAYARAVITVKDDTNLAYEINVYNVLPADITGIHIHAAKEGVNGAIVVPIYDSTKPQFAFEGNNLYGLTTYDKATFGKTGDFYLNIHTKANPSGALRGTVLFNNAPYSVKSTLSGKNEKVIVDPSAAGSVILRLVDPANILFKITISDLGSTAATLETLNTTVTGMHIHRGKAGVDGPVVIGLYPLPDGLPNSDDYDGVKTFSTLVKSGGYKFSIPAGESYGVVNGFAYIQKAEPGLIEEMMAFPENFYVNVHTKNAPSGVMRGQLGL